MLQNTRLKKRILLKSIDMIIGICSVILSYFLVGTVGEKITYDMLGVTIIYLPICILFAMILVKGYEISLKKIDIGHFGVLGKALLIGIILYLSIDLVMKYHLLMVCKLFSVILAFVVMIIVRIAYYLTYNKFDKMIRKKTVIK